MNYFLSLLFVLLIGSTEPKVEGEFLNIAVASHFYAPMQVLAEQFTESSGVQVHLSAGATGQLFTQIVQGAPFDVFFAADEARPLALEVRGLVVPGSRFTYVEGRLALWSLRPFESKKIEDMSFEHLAIANPKLAPYGAAAVEALQSLGVYQSWEDRLVYGQNAAQAQQFVVAGQADVAVISLAQAILWDEAMLQDSSLKTAFYQELPLSLHSPIKQHAVQISGHPVAEVFLQYLRSEEVRSQLQAWGYVVHQEVHAMPEQNDLDVALSDSLNQTSSDSLNQTSSHSFNQSGNESSNELNHDWFLAQADWQALWLSVKLAALTVALLLALATPLAWWLVFSRARFKFLIEALVALPLVLPPTVLGFYLLLLLGRDGPLSGLSWAFSFQGLVLASMVYSLPFVVQPIQSSLSQMPRSPLEAAATLGAGFWDRFFSVVLPLCKPGFVTATVLGFAHTLGEFGVVLMIGGNLAGETRVASIAIYEHVESLQWNQAHGLAWVLLSLSFVLLLLVYAFNGRTKGLQR